MSRLVQIILQEQVSLALASAMYRRIEQALREVTSETITRRGWRA